MRPDDEVLDLFGCEIDIRQEAPGVDRVIALTQGVERTAGAVRIRFDPAGTDTVRAFAAAETVCCAGLEWVVDGDDATLTISANSEQLDALETAFRPG